MHRIADEFTCTDCGRLICSVPPRDPPPTICMMCSFLGDEAEREELRRRPIEDPP